MEYVVTMLGLVAALWVIISASGALPIIMIAKMQLKPVEGDKARQLLRLVLTHKTMTPNWIGTHGFHPIGVFEVKGAIGNAHVVAWQHEGERTYLCVYVIQGTPKATDFVTSFEQGGLSTANGKDTHAAPPRPDRWVQSFKCDVAQLWEHHQAALEFLRHATGQVPSRREANFVEEFVTNVRAQANYVRSIPLWFLRMPYWYFVRRNLLHNKSVRQQFERRQPAYKQFSPE